jgi:plasmid stability protein
MANITVRNIPDDVFARIQRLSSIEKRSINSELLVIIERGMSMEMEDRLKSATGLPASIQISLWKDLSRRWKDVRSKEQVVEDIYSTRTTGREFKL